MSWNKNTIHSYLNDLVKVLDAANAPYSLTDRGIVGDFGLNEDGPITLRTLVYTNVVLMEQMQRTEDCDSDDYIVCLGFEKDSLLGEIPLEIMTHAFQGDGFCYDCGRTQEEIDSGKEVGYDEF